MYALRARDMTGRGQYIDIGLYESVFRILDEPTVYHDVEGVALQGAHRWLAGGLVLSGQWWTDPN